MENYSTTGGNQDEAPLSEAVPPAYQVVASSSVTSDNLPEKPSCPVREQERNVKILLVNVTFEAHENDDF